MRVAISISCEVSTPENEPFFDVDGPDTLPMSRLDSVEHLLAQHVDADTVEDEIVDSIEDRHSLFTDLPGRRQDTRLEPHSDAAQLEWLVPGQDIALACIPRMERPNRFVRQKAYCAACVVPVPPSPQEHLSQSS